MRKKSVILALFLIVYDQVIKVVIDKSFYVGKTMSIIPNVLLTKIHNDGAAWSLFAGKILMLIIVALAALVFLFIWEKKFKYQRRTMIGFGFIYGGLIGNMIDRIRLGYVIDYIKINFSFYNFPVFNFADVLIVVGFVLIFYALVKGEEKNESNSKWKWYKIR